MVYRTAISRIPRAELIFKPLFRPLRRGAWKDISINMLLLVLLGFLLGDLEGVLIGFLISACIKLIKLILHLGFCEMDDMLNNSLATLVEVFLHTGSIS